MEEKKIAKPKKPKRKRTREGVDARTRFYADSEDINMESINQMGSVKRQKYAQPALLPHPEGQQEILREDVLEDLALTNKTKKRSGYILPEDVKLNEYHVPIEAGYVKNLARKKKLGNRVKFHYQPERGNLVLEINDGVDKKTYNVNPNAQHLQELGESRGPLYDFLACLHNAERVGVSKASGQLDIQPVFENYDMMEYDTRDIVNNAYLKQFQEELGKEARDAKEKVCLELGVFKIGKRTNGIYWELPTAIRPQVQANKQRLDNPPQLGTGKTGTLANKADELTTFLEEKRPPDEGKLRQQLDAMCDQLKRIVAYLKGQDGTPQQKLEMCHRGISCYMKLYKENDYETLSLGPKANPKTVLQLGDYLQNAREHFTRLVKD